MSRAEREAPTVLTTAPLAEAWPAPADLRGEKGAVHADFGGLGCRASPNWLQSGSFARSSTTPEPPMPVIDVAELAPIRRLIAIARSDTGQSRRVANFLLAWWSAGSCGGFDLTDLWSVDKKIADDMLATTAFIAGHQEYPDSYGLREDFETLVALWRPQLLQKATC